MEVDIYYHYTYIVPTQYGVTMQRFNLYLTKHELDFLKRESKKTGLSIAEIIRRSIDFRKTKAVELGLIKEKP
jgi:hypothetical protein